MLDYDVFKKTLSEHEQQLLEQIFEEDVKKKEQVISEEITKDRLHLDVVNFCANLFKPDSKLSQDTEYRFLMVEPLYSSGIKNFDLAVFRNQNRSLLLIECKHSISDVKSLVNETNENISETRAHLDELQSLLGSKIDQIEYVLCVPAINAPALVEEVADQNYPICVWGCDMFTKEIRLFSNSDDSINEIKNGRIHRDKNLNKTLFKGVVSNLSAIRTVPILLSSHMCTLLIQINLKLYLERVHYGVDNSFKVSDIYTSLFSEYQKYSQANHEDVEKIAKSMIKIALRKEIYEDLTSEVSELKNKSFKVTGRQNKASAIAEYTEKKYIERNARKLAKASAIKRFKKKTGFVDLDTLFL